MGCNLLCWALFEISVWVPDADSSETKVLHVVDKDFDQSIVIITWVTCDNHGFLGCKD